MLSPRSEEGHQMKTKNRVMVSYRFSPNTLKSLKRYSKRKRVPATAVIEALINRYCVLAKEEK